MIGFDTASSRGGVTGTTIVVADPEPPDEPDEQAISEPADASTTSATVDQRRT
jgi:hypothetical protein